METPFSWCASRNKPAMRPSKVWSASCISFQKWPPIQIWAKVCTGSAMQVSNVFLADCTDILWHVYENHRSVLIVITRQECAHNVENWQPYLYASRDHSCHASSAWFASKSGLFCKHFCWLHELDSSGLMVVQYSHTKFWPLSVWSMLRQRPPVYCPQITQGSTTGVFCFVHRSAKANDI